MPRGSWSSSQRSRSSSSARAVTAGAGRPHGIVEQLAEVPFEQLVEDDYVWVGTPDEIVERIAQTRDLCPGITEIGITVNAGGAPHWMAIKNQELFAAAGTPRVGSAAVGPARPGGAAP